MKRLRWLVVLMLLALVAAACGGDDEPEATTEAPAATTEAPGATTEAPAATTEAPGATTEAPTAAGLVMDAGCDHGGKISKIEATSDTEVVFTLCSPDTTFLAKLAFTPFAIQSAAHLEATGGNPGNDPVGTGPFRLVEWQAGNQVILEANPDYWGDVPTFSTLVFQWREDSTQRLDLLTTGAADYITALAASDHELVEANPDTELLPDLNPNVFYIGFNNRFPPFDDVNVRRAVSLAIDRQRIIDTYYPGGSEVADFFTPCTIVNGCEGTPFPEFDPEEARRLLAEAGFPDGFDTNIFYRNVFRVYLPEPPAVAEDIQAQLLENLNINATIVEQESGAFLEESGAGNHDGLHLLGWGADYPATSNFLDSHFGGGANDQYGDKIPEIVDLLAQAGAAPDEAAAAPLYGQVNDLLVEHVPMLPVAWGASADAARTTLEGRRSPLVGAPQFQLKNPGDDDLVFVQNAEPITMYCPDVTDGETLSVCQQMFEGLYSYDVDGNVIPKLATGCERNEDGLMWTCTLREGVTFHDGSTLVADDVVRTFQVGLDRNDPLHVGDPGTFYYFNYLWGQFPPEG